MKSYVISVVILVALAVLVNSQRPKLPRRPKHCKSANDCNTDECCEGYTIWSSKCTKLTKEGQRCMLDVFVPKLDGQRKLQCPCQKGLECVAEKTIIEPGGGKRYINPRCIRSITTTTMEDITTVTDISSEEFATSAEQSEESKEE